MGFEAISTQELDRDAVELFRRGMPLLTAELGGVCNTMTVSWGQLGHLWNKQVATVYVRPQRFTFPLIDAAQGFSLSFLPTDLYADEILYCGRASGRDEDKFAHCGFTVARQDGIPYIEQASQVLLCRTCYSAWLTEDSFLDPAIVTGVYGAKDFHKQYIGEIIAALCKR